jgi:protein TonB
MIRARHWMLALGVALGVHLIILGLVLARESDEGARAPGEQGIEIDLGMLGDLGAATQHQQVAATEQPLDTAVTEPAPAEPQPDAAEPQTQPAAIPESESPESEPVPDIEPDAEPEPSPVKQVPQVPIKPRVSAAPKPPQASPAAPQPKTTRAAPASPGTETGQDSNDSRRMTTGSQNALSSGGNPGAEQSYYALIAAHLAQHKRYPIRARRKGEEGTARLFFILDRQGAIVEYRLTESSGHKTLDSAVIDMLKSAAPLPAFPADMKMTTLNIHLPVAFSIN